MDLRTLVDVFDLAERAGATRYYQTPAFGTITAASGVSGPQTIRFTRPGFVGSLLGQVASGTPADYGGTSMRVQIGGTEDVFVDGNGAPTFSPLLALFGGVQNERRLVRRVNPGDLWTFTMQTTIVGGVVPLALVSFLDDEDVSKLLAALDGMRARGR